MLITENKYLEDICVIRIILIFLLIIYHSFCPYTTSFWENPQGYTIPLYYWIGRTSYSFMLETFVFISGLILGYQVLRKGESTLTFNRLVKNKTKRLIIPSIIFSVFYYLLFLDLNNPPFSILMEIIEGAGHLWFLPMLFWCFVGIYILTRFSLRKELLVFLLFVIACLSVIKLPFRVNQSLYFLLFFYIGYSVGLRQIDLSKFQNAKSILVLFILFVILFPGLSYLRYGISEMSMVNVIGGGISMRIKLLAIYSFQHFSQIIYSTIGLFLIYSLVNYLINRNIINVNRLIVNLSTYCFGVYIFQEFIIRIFYYKIGAITRLNAYLFPWASILITLCLSLILTHLTLKTRIGRFLLG